MSGGTGRILAIDDQPYFRRFLEGLLSGAGYEVSSCATADLSGDAAPQGVSLVLIDPGSDAEPADLIQRVTKRHPAAPVIAFVPSGDVMRAVALMRAGARDWAMRNLST